MPRSTTWKPSGWNVSNKKWVERRLDDVVTKDRPVKHYNNNRAQTHWNIAPIGDQLDASTIIWEHLPTNTLHYTINPTCIWNNTNLVKACFV